MLMVVGVHLWVDSGTPWTSLLTWGGDVGVQYTGQLNVQSDGPILQEVPVDTVFVVGSSEDLGDDQSGGSGDNGGTEVVSEIRVLSQPKANGLVIKPAPYSPISKACFLKCLKLGSPYGTTISARDILWKIGLTLPWSLDTFWLGDVDWLDIGSVTVLLDRIRWVEVGVFLLGQRSSDLWNINEDDLLGFSVDNWDEIQWVGVLGVVFVHLVHFIGWNTRQHTLFNDTWVLSDDGLGGLQIFNSQDWLDALNVLQTSDKPITNINNTFLNTSFVLLQDDKEG
ncbi:hypothetical protein WICPIJ_008828 [Wickerhamomyces pijperi]|uniref:Uncharacterized protein n=1 Tax=Wickerhamomyces pijperi TaxID=599730 RepID=A0A9P8TH92_WICPI|nr:hypothetical protein WICPIJ_008828 [Wickerhamomyces pijperi]